MAEENDKVLQRKKIIQRHICYLKDLLNNITNPEFESRWDNLCDIATSERM